MKFSPVAILFCHNHEQFPVVILWLAPVSREMALVVRNAEIQGDGVVRRGSIPLPDVRGATGARHPVFQARRRSHYDFQFLVFTTQFLHLPQ